MYGTMYDTMDTEANKLKVFNENTKWQKIIDEFLAAWAEFFDYETGDKESWEIPRELSVVGQGLTIRWKHGGVYWGNYALTVSNIKRKRILRRPGWPRRVEGSAKRDIISFHRFDIISFHQWKSQDWFLWFINFDRLLDIVSATRLLRERALVAKDACEVREEANMDACEVHKDKLEIFNDYLDGLAEVL